MDGFWDWVIVILFGFMGVMIPITFILSLVVGAEMNLGIYISTFAELACILIYFTYRYLRKSFEKDLLKKKMVSASIISCAVSLALGIAISPLAKFEGSERSERSYYSYYSYNKNHNYDASSKSDHSGSDSYDTFKSTSKPKTTAQPGGSGYSGYSGYSGDKSEPEKTVDPDDHDIESYYLDYQDEFENEEDAWDDFEDDPDVWDDY